MHSYPVEVQHALKGARALVTGVTGFIGWHLAQALACLGVTVDGLSRTTRANNIPPRVNPLQVDLMDRDAVKALATRGRYDIIFHLAGLVDARQDRSLVLPMFDANLATTVNLMTVANEMRCARFVLVGSSEDFRSPRDGTCVSPYGAAKAAAHLYARLFHGLYLLPVVMLRLFMTYGPRQSMSKLVPFTIRKFLMGDIPHLSSGKKICDAIYVDDAVRGILAAAVVDDRACGGTFELGAGSGLTVEQIVVRIAQLMGASGKPLFGAIADRQDEVSYVADLGPAREVLRWTPTWDLDSGLMQTIEWYKSKFAEEVKS